MGSFQYRALQRGGQASVGTVEAADIREAAISLRKLGLVPVSVVAASPAPAKPRRAARGEARAAATTIISELAVLLGAGLQLERALALGIENIDNPAIATSLAEILQQVREGMPLSRAMAAKPEFFGPGEVAMAEAGEANGHLAAALSRLSEMLEAEAELARTIASAMVYPTILLVVATGVVLMMLLFVVPQFESLFAASRAPLPLSSRVVMAASQGLRQHGLVLGAGLAGVFVGARALLARPQVASAVDGLVLRAPLLGELVRRIETARFARTLGALMDGNVAVPAGFALAQRTIRNRTMVKAISEVTTGIREGGGVTGPLAATGMLPRLAIGFFRTGEESAQLGPMLLRLADVLDRDVKTRLERLLALFTPVVTALMGMAVAGIIAAIMSAILGFNEMAVSS